MKKKIYVLTIGLILFLFLTGCANNTKIENGTYYSVTDEWGEVELYVSDETDVTIRYVTINDAISELSRGFFRNSSDYDPIIFKGTIDQKKKELDITDPNNIKIQYKMKKNTIITSNKDKDDDDLNLTFYKEDDKELKTLRKEFKKNTKGIPESIEDLVE